MENVARVFGKIQKVLAIIGIITFAVLWIVFLIIGPAAVRISFSITCPICIGVLCLSLLFTNKLLDSIESYDKQTWIGVCNILFGIIFTGIFYLAWQPQSFRPRKLYSNSNRVVQRPHSSAIATNPKPTLTLNEKADLIKKYKDLFDTEAISKSEFDKIKKDILADSFNEVSVKTDSNEPNKSSSPTPIEWFDTKPYQADLACFLVGKAYYALKNFKKYDIEIKEGQSYRLTAHYSDTYQIMVNGNMVNLNTNEFIYAFIMKS